MSDQPIPPPSIEKLTDAEVIEELEGEISMYKESYAWNDGVVHDNHVLRTIHALTQAIERMREPRGDANDGG